MDKHEISQVLREIAILVELTDVNPKKGIAYRKAARSVDEAENFSDLLKEDALITLPGIGKEISKMIQTIAAKGYLSYLQQLKSKIPSGLLTLVYVPGLGTRKVRLLYEKFQIQSITDLKEALEKNTILGLPGFGPRFIEKLKKQIEDTLVYGPSLLYPKALQIALALEKSLEKYVQKIEFSGEVRRKCEIVYEIVLLATTKDVLSLLFAFTNHGYIREVLEYTLSYAKVLLKQGVKAKLQIVEEEAFPLTLLQTTGNETHINELHIGDQTQFQSEQVIYQNLGLHFIPPELREGYGEIEKAKLDDFSDLVTYEDLKGTFHCHTLYSDGGNTIKEMVLGAKKLGWDYIGITDHSKSSYFANGLSEERLLGQLQEIETLNKEIGPNFHIFSGVECDILKDGQLDFDDSILKQLDFVIVSVHSHFKLEEEIMTKRIIKAIENPYTTMLGHLSGRLLRIRDPYEINVPKIIDACIANQKIIELNAYPSRLDMDWRYWIQAKDKGLLCSINPDAHTLADLHNCYYGVNIARKGWLTKHDVINTLSLQKMKAFLKSKKPQN